MELFRDRTNTITFTNPDPRGQVLATVTFNGEPIPTAPVPIGGGKYNLVLPWVSTSGVFTVQWQFSVAGRGILIKTETHNITVPLVEVSEIRSELEIGPEHSDSHLYMAERRVRKIIEAHCGQKFEETLETLTVRGSGDNYLRMPKRLIEVKSMVDTRLAIPWVGVAVKNDGWFLKRTDGYYYDAVTTTAPIYAPYQYGGVNAKFPNDVEWAINGRWGWESVPSAVREAALVLLEQRVCTQTQYRDNFISTMRTSDWQLQFFQESNLGTGNVVADQLLQEYVVVSAAVI